MFTDDIRLYGLHAKYLKVLADDTDFYQRNIDVYINAAIVGLIFNKREVRDRTSPSKDFTTNILASAVNREKDTLDYIYRLIMILDVAEEIALEEKINKAFRDDSNRDISERHKQNFELFSSYVLGGIEVLYDKLIEEGVSKDKLMKNAYEFMKNRSEEIQIGTADKLIDDLQKKD